MNTFYLESLNYLINHPEDLGQPLETFLAPDISPGDRADLLTPDVMLASLDPGMLSPGRWPSNPDYGLYSAQLAALNLTLAPLRKQSGNKGHQRPSRNRKNDPAPGNHRGRRRRQGKKAAESRRDRAVLR
jgi:hypothetical protein